MANTRSDRNPEWVNTRHDKAPATWGDRRSMHQESAVGYGLFRNDRDLDYGNHVTVQLNFQFEVAHVADCTVRHQHFSLGYFNAGSSDGVGYVAGTHGTEQLAFVTSLG